MDLSLPLAAELAQARTQMALTLGFHIILACMGVAFPAMMLIANYRGLRKNDPVALRLAERWSKVAAVTFAVGAVTGTVLSFEFGLLWPEFTGRFGEVFGILFAIEGIFFFLEAIFITIYIFGWKRLSGWAHFWTGIPIVIAGLGGAFSVVAVNSWMNQPQGFTLAADGTVTDVDPLEGDLQPRGSLRGPAHDPRGLPGHGFPGRVGIRGRDAAGAAGPLPPPRPLDPADRRGDRDADPVRGRRHRGPGNREGPADQVRRDGMRADDLDECDRVHLRALHIGRREGRHRYSGPRLVPGGLEHRHGGHGAGHRSARRSPAREHAAALGVRHDGGHLHRADRCSGLWLGISWWRRRDIPKTPWFLRAVAVSGVASIVALECGWIVTEVGRQPWVVYEVMRTEDAVTGASGVSFTLAAVVLLYIALGVATVIVLRAMSRRWREADVDETKFRMDRARPLPEVSG